MTKYFVQKIAVFSKTVNVLKIIFWVVFLESEMQGEIIEFFYLLGL